MNGQSKPTTPKEWMAHMEQKLDRQTAASEKPARYYDSNFTTLSYAQEKFRDAFGEMFHGWNDNFCSLIVDSISERLSIRGFRMAPEEPPDKDAERIWQVNGLDAESNAAHIDALVRGSSFVVVWGDADGEPVVSPEPANQVTVQYKAGSRHELEAGFKRYRDDWGGEFCTLWTPEYVATAVRGADKEWRVDEDVAPNPLGVVPIAPLRTASVSAKALLPVPEPAPISTSEPRRNATVALCRVFQTVRSGLPEVR